jgi:integrase
LLEHRENAPANEHDLVFPNQNGEPLDVDNFAQRNFKRILKVAGLPNIRLYDLRHTCATLLLLAWMHAKVVSERLGHASIRETMDTYSHVLPSMQKQASDALEHLLFSDKSEDYQQVRELN